MKRPFTWKTLETNINAYMDWNGRKQQAGELYVGENFILITLEPKPTTLDVPFRVIDDEISIFDLMEVYK